MTFHATTAPKLAHSSLLQPAQVQPLPADPGPWVNLGACIGEAFQVADDIKDAVGDPETIGKAVGIDAKLGRPNAVHELGLDGATDRLKTLLEDGLDSVPHCTGRDNLVRLVRAQSERFVPEKMGRTAA